MYKVQEHSKNDLPSSKQLKRSTILALCGATFLMVTVVLPAEYGRDLTGIGNLLGLTEMGKIKQSLAQEAALQKLAKKESGTQEVTIASAPQTPPAATVQTKKSEPVATAAPASLQKHETLITLEPDEGKEVKIEMKQGAKATYEWTVEGGVVNYDVHGEPPNPPANFFHGYKKGRQVGNDQGELVAAFDGRHGWFFRNREKQPVTIKLTTKGEYLNIKRPS